MDFIDLKTQYRELQSAIDARMRRVLEHGQYIMGPEVPELESRLADFTGARYCITVASGTEALLIALMALGVRAGDEVITTPFTFVATAEVIAMLGATPVFVDVERDTGNIDASLIESAITSRTRAIIPVSLYGQPADMDAINSIAERYDIAVVEDAAQSFGATYKGRRSCNLSTVGCTSFFPSKPLGCYGDGGAIFTCDEVLGRVMREIRVHGQERRYYHTRIGVGGRMDTLQCAIVLAKLDRFEWEIARRRDIGARYNRHLADHVGLIAQREERAGVFAQYTLLVNDRKRLQETLGVAGIPTAVHYPVPLHRQPAYASLCRIEGSLTVAEGLAERVISLPMGPDLTSSDQDRVIAEVLRALASATI